MTGVHSLLPRHVIILTSLPVSTVMQACPSASLHASHGNTSATQQIPHVSPLRAHGLLHAHASSAEAYIVDGTFAKVKCPRAEFAKAKYAKARFSKASCAQPKFANPVLAEAKFANAEFAKANFSDNFGKQIQLELGKGKLWQAKVPSTMPKKLNLNAIRGTTPRAKALQEKFGQEREETQTPVGRENHRLLAHGLKNNIEK